MVLALPGSEQHLLGKSEGLCWWKAEEGSCGGNEMGPEQMMADVLANQ